jgi:hypothetical protein
MTLMADCWACKRNVEDALCVTVSLDGVLVAICDDCMARGEEAANVADPITDTEDDAA